MGSVAVLEEARLNARELERREMCKGFKQQDARRRVASRIGALPGTLRNLAIGRLKRIDADLRQRIGAALIREIEQEIGRLSHELEIHRRAGAHPSSAAVDEAETLLREAKRLLGQIP